MNLKDTELVEIMLKIDGEGSWLVVDGDEDIDEKWRERVGGDEVGPTRIIKIKLVVHLPRATEIVGVVPNENYPPINLTIVEEK